MKYAGFWFRVIAAIADRIITQMATGDLEKFSFSARFVDSW